MSVCVSWHVYQCDGVLTFHMKNLFPPNCVVRRWSAHLYLWALSYYEEEAKTSAHVAFGTQLVSPRDFGFFYWKDQLTVCGYIQMNEYSIAIK